MYLNNQTTCIIPFYNEEYRVFQVLEVVTQIKNITQIICVDDGSDDDTADIIPDYWPTVELIRLPYNQGKAAAIRHGLQIAQHENILLMDADLRDIDKTEIEKAIQAITRHNLDMLILRRINAPWFVKFDRGDILLSGERIVKKKDLLKVFNQEVNRYQVELAINLYMQKHKRNVGWMPWSATNTYKSEKIGLVAGYKKEFEMFTDIVLYAGFRNIVKQISSFATKKVSHE
ncbi:glycosyltransferase family 2 protein [Adhaeribacter pallidiroseus]|uniref:Undecaprenyl-phosphate 4-deoxy-4-formamido-L-arabinose transferase n=1 Tax=Adhaeribacter pallidiroseus TaxID=2072847 RepID=A0A369QW14_9BACT|nr:glycosyltransferase [Adhaeribacter pallidiroseus]RDC66358.1 Undecaprenyl-phosphate 4-deoxy-4-formamido-L-arabinose transferase [Adhaeribacter pallidiroseus]